MFFQGVGVVFIALQLSVFQELFTDILDMLIVSWEELSCRKILNIKINNVINDINVIVLCGSYETIAPEMRYRVNYSMSRFGNRGKKRQAYNSRDILHLSGTAMSEPGTSKSNMRFCENNLHTI